MDTPSLCTLVYFNANTVEDGDDAVRCRQSLSVCVLCGACVSVCICHRNLYIFRWRSFVGVRLFVRYTASVDDNGTLEPTVNVASTL